ncbi:hypothetical protein [Polymorphospora sp. NPDC050346]|uniref:hypothetical protein n=1 Tax=Polymorphospora sp. NPDC050346 TaxID=3155780 RepID=UPI0033DE4FB3
MTDQPLNDVLHPVWWRTVRAYPGRELTTGQLRELIVDVPVAPLYHPVGILAKAGVLRVVAERQVRGAVERPHRLDESQHHVDVAGAR